jgi:hypothetical protein
VTPRGKRRCEWQTATGIDWHHTPIPTRGRDHLKTSEEAWDTWTPAGSPRNWGFEDLRVLRQIVRLFDGRTRHRDGGPANGANGSCSV